MMDKTKKPPPVHISPNTRRKLERVASVKRQKFGPIVDRALDYMIRYDPELGGPDRFVDHPLSPTIDVITLGVN